MLWLNLQHLFQLSECISEIHEEQFVDLHGYLEIFSINFSYFLAPLLIELVCSADMILSSCHHFHAQSPVVVKNVLQF